MHVINKSSTRPDTIMVFFSVSLWKATLIPYTFVWNVSVVLHKSKQSK